MVCSTSAMSSPISDWVSIVTLRIRLPSRTTAHTAAGKTTSDITASSQSRRNITAINPNAISRSLPKPVRPSETAARMMETSTVKRDSRAPLGFS